MKKVFIFRLDDISWDMNFKNFSLVRDIFIKYDIKPLIGVIPNNKDEKLKSQTGGFGISEKVFWKEIYNLQNQYDWNVAIHGYDHIYVTNDSGILGINKRSEFAGLPFEIQSKKINMAKGVFKKHMIKSNIFMAPAHSFDWNTIKALKHNNINIITDGQCFFPYLRKGVWFVPQIRSWMKIKGYGYDTVCFHINNFTENDFINLENFLKENKQYCVSFSDVLKDIDHHKRLKWIFGNIISKPIQFLKNLYRFKIKTMISK